MLEGSRAGLDPGLPLLFVSRRGGGFRQAAPQEPVETWKTSQDANQLPHRPKRTIQSSDKPVSYSAFFWLFRRDARAEAVEISEAYRQPQPRHAPVRAVLARLDSDTSDNPPMRARQLSDRLRVVPYPLRRLVKFARRTAGASPSTNVARRAKLICPPSPGPSTTPRPAPVPPTAATGGSAPSWRAWARP